MRETLGGASPERSGFASDEGRAALAKKAVPTTLGPLEARRTIGVVRRARGDDVVLSVTTGVLQRAELRAGAGDVVDPLSLRDAAPEPPLVLVERLVALGSAVARLIDG